MRQKQVKTSSRKKKLPGPLVEVPLNSHGHRDWQCLTDEQVIRYAQKFVNKNRIKNKKELFTEDSGLYSILNIRKLLDRVEFEGKLRRHWSKMTDDELVAYAQKIVDEKGITNRSGLEEEDGGLSAVLRKRKLLDRVELKGRRRTWATMIDEQLVKYAQKFVEKGIKNRRGLSKADSGLYTVLLRRKLLDRIEFEDKKQEQRNWKLFGDDELVAYAQRFIDKKEIKNRGQLQRKSKSLYRVLRRRKLLDRIKFEEKKEQRNWKSFSDYEIVNYTKKIIDNGVRIRSDLKKYDGGLHHVLIRRNLLDQVFAPIEQQRKNQALSEIIEAVKEF